MSYSLDVNVLLYASDRSSNRHDRARRFAVAAILFQHGVRTLYTNDRDFRKFELLDVRDPFS